MLVQTIDTVPSELFQAVLDEINTIDWEFPDSIDCNRANNSVFYTSRSIHLRTHAPPSDKPLPTNVEEWSMITECKDRPEVISKFPAVCALADWMYSKVHGIKLGRIMIVNLLPGGTVPPHIDPLDYFEMYSRYHVPVITNDRVKFFGGKSTVFEHMPVAVMSRLNNRTMHAVANRGTQARIHIIVDIATPGGNVIF